MAALFSAVASFPGLDPKMVHQAQQAMTDAMGVGTEHRALLERQWAIMQATAAAVQGDGDTSSQSIQRLELARAYFDVAVEAVRAVSQAAGDPQSANMDEIVRHFYERLAQMRGADNI